MSGCGRQGGNSDTIVYMHKFNHRGSVIASMLFGIIVLLIAAGAVVMFHSNLADFYYEVKKDLLPATAVVQKYITVTSTKKVEKSSAVTKVERKKSKSEAPSASNPPMESQVGLYPIY